MLFKEKVSRLRSLNRDLVREYDELLREIETNDLIAENNALKKELQKLRAAAAESDQKYQALLEKKQGLEMSLKEQILDEKLNILKISREKLDLYFKNETGARHNKLALLEKEAMQLLAELRKTAEAGLAEEKQHLKSAIEQLSADIHDRIRRKQEALDQCKAATAMEIDSRAGQLAEEEISEEVIRRRIKQNNVEVKIGLKWINRIGMLLILLGVGSVLHWSYYNWFTDHMKGIFALLIGALFLGAGEYSNRKGKNVFGLGLTGGGIAVLYYAIFNSYFSLGIISLQVGALLSLLVTAVAFLLSTRYRSKTICAFALIGGYLPFFTYIYHFGPVENSVYLAMGYFAFLHLLTLLLALNHRWTVITYLSFLFNLPTLIYLVTISPHHPVSILYTFAIFLLYLGIVLAYPMRHKIALNPCDVILLALNTAAGFSLLYYLFGEAGLGDFRGLLALAFGLTYLGLARFLNRFVPEAEKVRLLFYLTSLTFIILVVPFQFGVKWLSLGWLIEAVLLIIFGKQRGFRGFERAGWVIFAFCLAAFTLIDLPLFLLAGAETFFTLKYSAVTAGLVLILFRYLFEFKKDPAQEYSVTGRLIKLYKYFTVLNFWLFLAYLANHLYLLYVSVPLARQWASYPAYDQIYQVILFGLVTLSAGLIVSKVKIIGDRVTGYIVIFIYTVSGAACLFTNLFVPVPYPGPEAALRYFALGVLVAYNILVLLAARDVLIRIIRDNRLNLEYYPLAITLYLMGTVTALIIVQFQLGQVNLILSLFYLVLAFASILVGFKKGFVYLRRLGLGLSLFATAKLFLYDLSHLSDVSRVLAFFAFGFLMLAISYTYHKLNAYMGEKRSL